MYRFPWYLTLVSTNHASSNPGQSVKTKETNPTRPGSPTPCNQALKLNANSVTNSHELSNAFNDHFSTIGTKLANEVPLVTDGSRYADYIVSSDNKFIFSPISSSNVFPLLHKLSKSKATGLDNISAKLIRECADLISIPLRNIFNNSLSSGLFPDDWKCARVTPLFKQGERTDVNNYRPISVI